MIHLSLRHKLRQNLLPPLSLITDTNCGESNFWAAPGAGGEDPEAAKLKTATSWHKIFATMCQIHEWHKAGMTEAGLLSPEAQEYVEWVKGMDVQMYMRLSDKIMAELGDKELTMPETTIMNYDLATL